MRCTSTRRGNFCSAFYLDGCKKNRVQAPFFRRDSHFEHVRTKASVCILLEKI